MNVAVLGAGNGGQAVAAHLTLTGHNVRLYDRYPEVVDPLRRAGCIELTGALEGRAVIAGVTDDLSEAVSGADTIIVSLPGFAFEYIARELAPLVRDHQVVVLHPGGTGGAFEVRRVWRDVGITSRVALGATETLVYACRQRAPGSVDVKAVKRAVMVAGLPSDDGMRAFEVFHLLFPQAELAASVLETSFANTNPVMHPPIVIWNGRLTDQGEVYDFYGSGVSPGVARIIDAVDRERMAIAAAYEVPARGHHAWAHHAYGVTSSETTALLQEMAAQIYRGIESPPGLRSRYLTEDVPLGLVPLAELARQADVGTPVIDSIITLASLLCEEDFRATGRTLERMGLAGMKPKDIHDLAVSRQYAQAATGVASG
jgi:opine dehydrogenase